MPIRVAWDMSDLSRFRSLPEAEGRVLLLILAFSGTEDRPRSLEGRIKLAKLDFLVRYPKYLKQILESRNAPQSAIAKVTVDEVVSQDRMIRYRYGPWDPSYYAVLGSLIGRALVEPIPFSRGIGYRATTRGRQLAESLTEEYAWAQVLQRAKVARTHLDLSGTTLKDLLYSQLPMMAEANWDTELS